MRRSALAVLLLALPLAACGGGSDDGGDGDATEVTARNGNPFDPAAEVWITAVVGGGILRLDPDGRTVEIAASDADADGSPLATLADEAAAGDVVDQLTTGGPELTCAAAFDGPSYEITLHLTDGDEVVGTCGQGAPLADNPLTTSLLALVDAG